MFIRLLNVYSLKLEEFSGANTPEYVIASHRWGREECTFKDVSENRNPDKEGYKKVKEFCAFVRRMNTTASEHGPDLSCHWLWIDTCCIDKSSSQEVSRSINSMFRYYSEAICCYAYLNDVKPLSCGRHEVKESFCQSQWFIRGWTLQELLAPQTVVFLTGQWEVLGHKCTRSRPGGAQLSNCPGAGDNINVRIAEVTGIPKTVLFDFASSKDLSVEERMTWASGRKTAEREDMAYCLLGIFGVSMTLNYSEGREKATWRLEDEIKLEQSNQKRRRGNSQSFSSVGARVRPSPCTTLLLAPVQVPSFQAGGLSEDHNAVEQPRHPHAAGFQVSIEEVEDEATVSKSSHTQALGENADETAEIRVKRGRTRIPKRLVRIEALRDLEYVFTEEDNVFEIPLALGKLHIDELLERAQRYTNMKSISYKISNGSTITAVKSETRRISPSLGHQTDRGLRKVKSQTRPINTTLSVPNSTRPRSSSTPEDHNLFPQAARRPPTRPATRASAPIIHQSNPHSPGIGPQDPTRYTLPKNTVQAGTMSIQIQYAERPPEHVVAGLKRDVEELGLDPNDVRQHTKDSIEMTFYEIEVFAPYNKLSHRKWDEFQGRLKESYVHPLEMGAIAYKFHAKLDPYR